MRTIALNLYTFEELTKEVQSKVLDKNRLINVECDSWYEFMIEDFKEHLLKKGFKYAEIYFSGFWSQGDGLCFDAEINTDNFLPNRLKGLECGFSINKNSYSNHYSHERTRYIDWEINHNYNGKNIDNIESLVVKVCEDLQQEYYNICKDFYNQLMKCYEDLTSDESVKECLISNCYEYDEFGNIN